MAHGTAVAPLKQYRYYDFITAAFVTVLLCSNLIGPAKIVQVGGFTLGAGILFFPISYLFGDILTEVYGYARTRRVVWTGFGALAFASLMTVVVLELPAAPGYPHQEALRTVFGQTPRIVVASLAAFWAGEFANSFAMAKMKLRTEGRRLWERAIGSTVIGAAVDSAIFYPVAFLGVWSARDVLLVTVTNYVLKVLWEVLALPVTYRVVRALKRAEHEDYYDRTTDFTPFSLQAD